MPEERVVALSAGGPTPVVCVVVGHASWASCVARIAPPDGAGWKWESREFHSWDDRVIEIRLDDFAPEDLDDHMLVVDLVITPEKVGDWMTAQIDVRQGGIVVPGGTLRPIDEASDSRLEPFRRKGLLVAK